MARDQHPLLLMTPGPTRVPERVLAAGAQPMIHHRTPEFSHVLGSVLDGIRSIFDTTGDVVPVHSTGRGAMEAAICNLFSPGDELVACCNGKFGELWATIAESHGVVVHRVSREWRQSVDPAEVADALERHPSMRGVTVTHCDTATGVLNDVRAVCEVARRSDALAMIDGISAIGGTPFHFDMWGADVAIVASQKCLMCSPGLAFAALSERAWEATDRATLPRNYWDFPATRSAVTESQPETPGTAPVHLFLQVRAALEEVATEGLDKVFARHEAMSRMMTDWMADRGLEPQCPDLKRLSPTLTAVATPPGIAPDSVRAGMVERGILIARGLGKYRGSAFRIGHMGDIRLVDVQRTLDALDEVMAELRLVATVIATDV